MAVMATPCLEGLVTAKYWVGQIKPVVFEFDATRDENRALLLACERR